MHADGNGAPCGFGCIVKTVVIVDDTDGNVRFNAHQIDVEAAGACLLCHVVHYLLDDPVQGDVDVRRQVPSHLGVDMGGDVVASSEAFAQMRDQRCEVCLRDRLCVIPAGASSSPRALLVSLRSSWVLLCAISGSLRQSLVRLPATRSMENTNFVMTSWSSRANLLRSAAVASSSA